jgi:hypothetical protein
MLIILILKLIKKNENREQTLKFNEIGSNKLFFYYSALFFYKL